MAQSAYKPVSVSNGGTIEGRVVLVGSESRANGFVVTKDEKVCGASEPDQSLIVGKDRGVANTVVYLETVTAGKAWGKSWTSVLDQHHCMYVPHVSIIPANSALEIVNDDPILHNVHLYTLGSTEQTICNIAQPIKGQRTKVDQLRSLTCRFIFATCDAGHPWMGAYIVRADNPYYVLTDAKGEFRLTDVPPGTYTLTMWHEGVKVVKKLEENGKVSKYYFEEPYSIFKAVKIAPKATVHVDFRLSLRSPSKSITGAE